ncbi:hypothetical protein EON63_16025, partial [archaeon]
MSIELLAWPSSGSEPPRILADPLPHLVVHSGTHFVKNVLAQQPGVFVWDEICRHTQLIDGFGHSCLDLMSFLLDLPTFATTPEAGVVFRLVGYLSHYLNPIRGGNNTVCNATDPLSNCYPYYFKQLRSVGMLIQQNQGWGDPAFM